MAETIRLATESICRPGGLADQLRSRGIVMLGVGLGDAAARPSSTSCRRSAPGGPQRNALRQHH
ncbi:hypothetical protein BZL30_9184 [Mycobacterium kansasii]|uniref:Uncharacterized protein n=1 Tax=Mycobacterium kansasii TaxID=1768 RepID=A0A1V3WAT1_MYCKA|nr:hypothetical protein BZL30_9184 [Mycobacterium kansasii]